jgi:hypothetical protein
MCFGFVFRNLIKISETFFCPESQSLIVRKERSMCFGRNLTRISEILLCSESTVLRVYS